jgi:hypothetical protein
MLLDQPMWHLRSAHIRTTANNTTRSVYVHQQPVVVWFQIALKIEHCVIERCSGANLPEIVYM